MKIAKVKNAGFLILSLWLFATTEPAWSVARVESRSQPQPVWTDGSDGIPSDPIENPSLEFLRKMEFLQQEVQELRGKVEEQNYQLLQLQEHQKKLYLDLERRLREGGTAAPSKAIDSNPSGITFEHSSSNSHPDEPAAEEKSYQNAYRLIQNKDYDGALSAFKSLLKTFPHGKYVPNAHYWLGEIYLSKESFDLAGQAFTTVYRDYPQHPKAADSLLKMGYVEYAKGQWKDSQKFLAQVKSQFPGTTSAQLAEVRLDRMKQEGH